MARKSSRSRYHSSNRKSKSQNGWIVLVVLLAVVAAFFAYAYNRGPGKDRISGDVDQYGREMK